MNIIHVYSLLRVLKVKLNNNYKFYFELFVIDHEKLYNSTIQTNFW